jgi:hypothetical protein
LEQAKLKASGKPLPFAGEIALVTGGSSGIGKACVDALLARKPSSCSTFSHAATIGRPMITSGAMRRD